MLSLTKAAEERRLKRFSPVEFAKRTPFANWAADGNFIADREPIDFSIWRYLRPIYEAVPMDPAGLDMVIMKSAQGGASILALLWTLWVMLRTRCQLAYFLPTAELALNFSRDRFIKLARENGEIHRLMGDPGSPYGARVVDEGSARARRILESIAYFTHITGRVTTEALPLDALVFDEVQEMLLADIEKAEERLSASPLQAILRISTANFAGSDIHYFYERSDQREFHTRCKCPSGIVLADAWDPRTGPLCIDRGNGSTPGVPRDWFYTCPRCRSIITDPQDGEFRPKNPGCSRIGFQFPQLLSPRQSPGRIIEKWERRVDTKNFYNRVLGRPYVDPNTQPVTEAHLNAAQNPDLTWAPLPHRTGNRVFMGIDQMGQENYVIIKAKVGDRMRLLHLEIIQNEDPWRRCTELMREFRVQIAVVESLPNFNEAHRFAREHEGKVFLASYHDQPDEILRWGDRLRDGTSVSRSDDAIRTPWTVSVDQYKMMAWSLAKWAGGEIETPDARVLTQCLRTRQGVRSVAVCRDVLWVHLQRVALVTEPTQGKEDERRFRRSVKKIGIDPHFAFANMLCDVAWVRAHGTTRMLFADEPAHRPSEKKKPNSDMEQLTEAFPELFGSKDDHPSTCGDCIHFDADHQRCTEQNIGVEAKQLQCDLFILDTEDEDYD
ncbi:MAG: phage terminase large subunit family protein [Candidatus Binatia bacterium]